MKDGREVDMDLYSRQIGTIGYEAMCRLRNLSVFISGMNGTGCEAAKNLILAGPKLVTVHDDTEICISDLGSNCFLEEKEIGQSRARVCTDKLQDLNSYVNVTQHIGLVTAAVVSTHDIVVAVDYEKVALDQLSTLCRDQGVKFVAVNSFGLCASVFVDFGPEHVVHDVDGEEPKSLLASHITLVEDPSNRVKAVVQCVEDKKVPFEVGAVVTLKNIEVCLNELTPANAPCLCALNNVPLKVTKVSTFSLEVAEFESGVNITGVSTIAKGNVIAVSAHVTGVKKSKTIKFRSYTEACLNPIGDGECGMTTVDFAKFGRAEQLHICTQALLQSVVLLGNKLPDLHSDFDRLLAAANEINSAVKAHPQAAQAAVDKIDVDVLTHICRFAGVILSPLSVVLGGIVAQEIVKATGKYTPIHQWLYVDCFELVEGLDYDKNPTNFQPIGCRYDDNIQIWGKEIQEALTKINLFLVGAGALGCEYLKNFALLGLCCGPKTPQSGGPLKSVPGGGQLTITDMDRIETSNLNRQFLFRKKHIGMSKSVTAKNAVCGMNNMTNVCAVEGRVGVDTETTIFTEEFWDNLDVVVNALDNVPSRLYIDGKCVWHLKPLLESGTLGTKGNVQVVIPNLTQSYGDSRDPPDESIPLCTLRLFPNQIEHTMEWGRDLFQGLFTGAVQDAQNILKCKGNKAPQSPQQMLESYSRMEAFLTLLKTKRSSADLTSRKLRCVQFAVNLLQKLFHDDIEQLLYNFPIDHLNNDGTPFWVGNKRPPQPITLDLHDTTQMDFVEACANLMYFTVENGTLDHSLLTREEILRLAPSVKLEKFEPRKMVIKTTDEEEDADAAPAAGQEMDELMLSKQDELEQRVKALVEEVLSHGGAEGLTAVEFEKDDDTNFHIQFIAASGNLRARNYKIPEIERWRAKLIAGKIIPAVATTTAMVTGFATIELLKVLTHKLLNRKLECYKDMFANMSLPLFLLSEPMPPKVMKGVDYDPIVGGPVRCKPATFTPWDKVVVDLTEPGCSGTMQELIDRLEKKFQTEVTILSAGNVCLFMSYSRSTKVTQKMRDIVAQTAKDSENSDLSVGQGYCVIQACCTDSDGVDVNIPVVKCIY